MKRLLLLSLLAAGMAAHTLAATLQVTNGSDGPAPGPPGSLRRAINDAAAGDTVIFAAGLTTVALTSGELALNKNLTIAGPGANLLSVQRSTEPGTPLFRIFNIGAVTVTISRLSVTGGAGIESTGTLTIAEVSISGNSSPIGGGIRHSGSLTVLNSTIAGNSGSVGGGIFTDSGATATISNSTISGNAVVPGFGPFGFGGGVFNNNGTVNLTDCTITNNSATDSGGGIVGGESGVTTLRNTIVALNRARFGPNIGGRLTSQGSNLIGDVDGTATFNPTTGDQVGVAAAELNIGPLQDNGGRTFTHALLPGSTAIERGNSSSPRDQRGGARPVDSPTIANGFGSNGSDIGAYEVQADQLPGCSGTYQVLNNADDGAGSLRDTIANACNGSTITFAPDVTGTISLTSGELALTKSLTVNGPGARVLTINGNNASRIFNVAAGPTVTIANLTMANGNSVGVGSGGALFNSGTLTLANCAVQDNSGGSGGGVANAGTLAVSACTFARNQSTGNGGALRNTGIMSVSNSTLNNNTAVSSGAIASFNNGPAPALTVTNCTISDNRGTDPNASGGGILNGGTAVVANTIVANNTAANGTDISGAFSSSGSNIIRIGTGGSGFTNGVNGDQVGTAAAPVDPSLGALQNNGGPTDTMALPSGSIAIDAGNDANAPSTDQRGYLRSGVSDIGAYEFGGSVPVPPTVLSVVSRKTHGATGTFDIVFPFAPPLGVECRTGGASGMHQVLVTFANPVTVGGLSVMSRDGKATATQSVSGAVVTIDLAAVANAQTVGITLINVNDGANAGDVPISFGVLAGDTTGNGSVTASDIGQTKAQSGQPLSAANFRTDVNVSGSVNASDIGLVKSTAGSQLPGMAGEVDASQSHGGMIR